MGSFEDGNKWAIRRPYSRFHISKLNLRFSHSDPDQRFSISQKKLIEDFLCVLPPIVTVLPFAIEVYVNAVLSVRMLF